MAKIKHRIFQNGIESVRYEYDATVIKSLSSAQDQHFILDTSDCDHVLIYSEGEGNWSVQTSEYIGCTNGTGVLNVSLTSNLSLTSKVAISTLSDQSDSLALFNQCSIWENDGASYPKIKLGHIERTSGASTFTVKVDTTPEADAHCAIYRQYQSKDSMIIDIPTIGSKGGTITDSYYTPASKAIARGTDKPYFGLWIRNLSGNKSKYNIILLKETDTASSQTSYQKGEGMLKVIAEIDESLLFSKEMRGSVVSFNSVDDVLKRNEFLYSTYATDVLELQKGNNIAMLRNSAISYKARNDSFSIAPSLYNTSICSVIAASGMSDGTNFYPLFGETTSADTKCVACAFDSTATVGAVSRVDYSIFSESHYNNRIEYFMFYNNVEEDYTSPEYTAVTTNLP